MKKGKIIIGPNGSGKTMVARRMSAGLRHPLIVPAKSFDRNYDELWKGITADTEFVIVDDAFKTSHIEALFNAVATGEILVNEKNKDIIRLPCPNIIITCDERITYDMISSDSFLRRFDVINLFEEDDNIAWDLKRMIATEEDRPSHKPEGPGRIVKTKTGKLGRTYNSKGQINNKIPVYLATKIRTDKDLGDVPEEYGRQAVLCDPSTLQVIGYID